MVFKKIIFQNSLMANETPSRPPPFMANAILNFHFDYLKPSLTYYFYLLLLLLQKVAIMKMLRSQEKLRSPKLPRGLNI